MFEPSRRPMLQPPFLGTPLVPLKQVSARGTAESKALFNIPGHKADKDEAASTFVQQVTTMKFMIMIILLPIIASNKN